ncbi:MAG: AbrB/MazE/SpoVT family DNA-binding domain-containing protein [Nitrososphaeria archaeon]
MTIESRIGKKHTIYLPKPIVDALNLKEGEMILVSVDKNSIVIEIIRDPIELALSGKKFASIEPKQIEEVSLEEQKKYT